MKTRAWSGALALLLLTAVGCPEEQQESDSLFDGWTVILGGEAPNEGGYPRHPHCLYQVPLGAGPAEELYCPGSARWIDLALRPRPGHDELLFVAEVDAHSGVYSQEFPIYEPWVQELYRLSISGGEPQLLGYWLSESYEGVEPTGNLYGAMTLGDGAAAVHWTRPEAHGGNGEELVVIDAAGDMGPDLADGLDEIGLLAVLPDGDLLVRTAAAGEPQLALATLDPHGAGITQYEMPADAPLAADVESHNLDVEPAGERVLLDVAGYPTIVGPDGHVRTATALAWGEHTMGWAGDGGVLLERDGVVWWWDGVDGGDPVEIGTPAGADSVSWGAAPHPDGDQGAFFFAYGEGNDSDFPVWYRDGALVPGDADLSHMQGVCFAHGTDDPIALIFDSDWESSTRNQVFACGADGTCDEVLSSKGLRGVLLPHGQIW